VEEILQGLPERPPRSLRTRIGEIMERALTGPAKARWPVLQAAMAFALFAAVLGGLWTARMAMRRSDPRSEFEALAVKVHQLHLKGKLPLELHSSSPVVISDWFKGRLPFKVTLPAYDEVPERGMPYQLEGARRVSFRNDAAAYVAYHTGGKPVSFVALPTSLAPPLRGTGVVMGKLTIYYHTLDGFHVITWSGPRSRLTYALVTDLEHPSQSCILCHAGSSPKDRDLMRTLNQQ
jgi:anti-sigma factor RsiW